ncbi:MAG: hypothetical protein IIW01_05805, partial [Thermoguttaceae bacterium]|nr:hypothetical protein [Thermoguttaceae bacterium]
MRRDKEIGRVVGLILEAQSLVEDHIARAQTLKTDAPPQIVEVAYQPPQADAPCLSISQDEVNDLTTVDDFGIPALREDAENPEEKNRNLPRKIRMDKFLRKPFPKSLIRSRPRPRDVEARLPDDRAPCVLPPRRRMKKKILSLEPLGLLRPLRRQTKRRSEVASTTIRPAKASLISIFATDVKTRRRKNRLPKFLYHNPSTHNRGGMLRNNPQNCRAKSLRLQYNLLKLF